MPAWNERVQNRPLAGHELKRIIEANVSQILEKDGMFTHNIAFARVSYEVRVTLHLDNPSYPEHVSTTLSRPASKQELEKTPELTAIEPGGGLKGDLTDEEVLISTELHGQILSGNAARVENDLPLITTVKDENGARVDKEIKYVGDKPNPADYGNTTTIKDVSEDQAAKMGRKKK